MSIPSIVELAGVFENPGSALRYLVIHEVLQVPEICSREACEGQMKVYNRLKPYLYRCTRKRTCGMYLSVYKDSFFGSKRLSANKVLLIAYLWLTKSLNSAMITQVGVSGNTITDSLSKSMNPSLGSESTIVDTELKACGSLEAWRSLLRDACLP